MVDYHFYNVNPLNKIENDCVCRAISGATGIPYYKIQEKLNLIGKLFECDKLCVCCYHHLLEKVFGFIPKVANGKTVGQIAQEFSNNTLIIRIQGHLTMAKDGSIYDIWDCRDEPADVFWVVN